jgi:hypothetical protein
MIQSVIDVVLHERSLAPNVFVDSGYHVAASIDKAPSRPPRAAKKIYRKETRNAPAFA